MGCKMMIMTSSVFASEGSDLGLKILLVESSTVAGMYFRAIGREHCEMRSRRKSWNTNATALKI